MRVKRPLWWLVVEKVLVWPLDLEIGFNEQMKGCIVTGKKLLNISEYGFTEPFS